MGDFFDDFGINRQPGLMLPCEAFLYFPIFDYFSRFNVFPLLSTGGDMLALFIVVKAFVPFGRVSKFKRLPFQGFHHERIMLIRIVSNTFASEQTSSR